MKSSNFVVKALLATLVTSCAVVPAAEASLALAAVRATGQVAKTVGNRSYNSSGPRVPFIERLVMVPVALVVGSVLSGQDLLTPFVRDVRAVARVTGVAVIAGAGYAGYKHYVKKDETPKDENPFEDLALSDPRRFDAMVEAARKQQKLHEQIVLIEWESARQRKEVQAQIKVIDTEEAKKIAELEAQIAALKKSGSKPA